MTRERLTDPRDSITRRFQLPRPVRAHCCPACAHRWEEVQEPITVYAVVGQYPDGRPGELFLYGDHAGSMAHGLLDGLALAVSIGLQYGAPLAAYADKFRGMIFGPGGITGDHEFPTASSVLDMLGRWLAARFGGAL